MKPKCCDQCVYRKKGFAQAQGDIWYYCDNSKMKPLTLHSPKETVCDLYEHRKCKDKLKQNNFRKV